MKITKLAAALAVVGLVMTAIAGPAMAAAPSVDSESTDTTTTSEVTAGSTQTYNDSTNSTLSYSADSNSTGVDVQQGDRTLESYEQNSSDVLEWQTTATSTYYVNATFADDASDYTGIEADAGENVDLTAEIINDTSLGADADTTNVSYTFANDANTSFIYYNDSETETATISTWSVAGLASSLSTVNPFANSTDDSDAGPARIEQEIGVNGDSQDKIHVYTGNSDAASSLAKVYDASDTSDGVAYLGTTTVNGKVVPMMAEGAEAPEWVDTSEDAYMTIQEDGKMATVHNAGSLMDSDDETATVKITANEKMDFADAESMFSSYDYDGNVWYAAFTNGEYFGGNPTFEAVA
ncbi:hypothetical protein [Haloarcula amylovorans]|uniref:hypothetical protein n=1 Tax=Haloarcula amylovorans TaxID=2562280 RepID=UPI001075E8B1|nr:hypothetical protein [Halomicroarcula amylolytica]